MSSFDYSAALTSAHLKRATHDRPTRENLAFDDGFDAGWNAAIEMIGRIVATRFQSADRGVHGELPEGVSREYLKGAANTCVAIATDLVPHAR